MNHPGILCFGEPKPGTRAKEIGFKISDYEAPPLPPQAPQPLGDVEAASLTVWTTTPEEVAERAATRRLAQAAAKAAAKQAAKGTKRGRAETSPARPDPVADRRKLATQAILGPDLMDGWLPVLKDMRWEVPGKRWAPEPPRMVCKVLPGVNQGECWLGPMPSKPRLDWLHSHMPQCHLQVCCTKDEPWQQTIDNWKGGE